MRTRDIVVLGASAGGVEALSRLVGGLPPGLPAALFVVCHIPPAAPSKLPEILSRRGPLHASHARNGEPVRPGHIYVAPPDYHMQLAPGFVKLVRGPRENRTRPAIDPLFRSAARAYGQRVVGVVLSGALCDGSAGLLAIRNAGGVAVIQDPDEAAMAAMPRSAQEVAGADHVLPVAEIAALLADLARSPVPKGAPSMTDPLENMPEVVQRDMAAQENGARRGQLTVFTCPECGGSLWQVDETELTRFRCHTGHAYYAETLLAEQSEALEAALWTAVRTFKERTILARQLAAQERQRNNSAAAEKFEEAARLAERYGELIVHNLLRANGRLGEPVPGKEAGAPGLAGETAG
jgi:two-component system chemotaxis response regulator CheB